MTINIKKTFFKGSSLSKPTPNVITVLGFWNMLILRLCSNNQQKLFMCNWSEHQLCQGYKLKLETKFPGNSLIFPNEFHQIFLISIGHMSGDYGLYN